MDIFQALKKDHKKVQDLLELLTALADDDTTGRTDIVQEIRDELIPHARAEESLLYNSLRALNEGEDVVGHSFREHMEVEALLRALQIEDKLGMGWKKTAIKLKEAVNHHIAEEEGRLFAVARAAIDQQEAEELGDLFEQLKPQIADDGFLQNSMDMILNLLPPRFAAALRKHSA